MFNALVTRGVMVLTDVPSSSGIDFGVVDDLVNVVKTVIDLFTIFPLNIFLTGSMLLLAAGIFSKLRHS